MAFDDDLLRVKIFNILPYSDPQQGGAGGGAQSFLVFLKGDTDKVVPINIGHFEGQALVMALRKIPLPRPLPHNLLQQVLEKMNATVRRLVIHTLKEEVFHAHLLIETAVEEFTLDCRPSDGMILATLLDTPLFMTQRVMDEAGRFLQVKVELEEPDRDEERTGVSPEPGVEGEDEDAVHEDAKEAASGVGPGEGDAGQELSEAERLNVRLARLIAEEAYEEAARVRDQLRRMESSE